MNDRLHPKKMLPAVVPKTGKAVAAYPTLSPPEQLERDLATLREITVELNKAMGHYDLENLRRQVGRAENQIADSGLDDLESDLENMDEPATRDDIASQLLVLIGSFPQSTQADLTIYSR